MKRGSCTDTAGSSSSSSSSDSGGSGGGGSGRSGRSGGGSSKGSTKLGRRIMVAPLRALCRARDLYVNGMTGIADRTSSCSVGRHGGHPSGSPALGAYAGRFTRSGSGSGSSSGGEDDLRELVRAASSTHGSPGSTSGDSPNRPAGRRGGSGAAVPRSQSMGMARIDEEGPCDFGGDAVVVGMFPRSRSCEVPKQRVGVMSS